MSPPPPGSSEPGGSTPTPACKTTFRDLDGGTAAGKAASCLADRGIVAGYDDRTYRPSRPVTRAQMASFITRAIEDVDGELAVGPDRFTDPLPAAHAGPIRKLVAAEVASGFPDGTYRPAASVTRGQMATFLARAAEHVNGQPLPKPARSPFTDTRRSVHAEAIDRVANAGIALGVGGGTYDPGSPVTRAQMALFLSRWLDTVE